MVKKDDVRKGPDSRVPICSSVGVSRGTVDGPESPGQDDHGHTVGAE